MGHALAANVVFVANCRLYPVSDTFATTSVPHGRDAISRHDTLTIWFRSRLEVSQVWRKVDRWIQRSLGEFNIRGERVKREQRVAAEIFADSLSIVQDPQLEPNFAGGRLILRRTKPNSFKQ